MSQLEPVSILTVEDDPIQQASLGLSLDEMGYRCVGMEASGEAALKTFRKEVPDIVLLDIQLKGKMDGIELGHKINHIRKTPLIFLTSFDDGHTFNRARNTLPVAYLVKPINIPSLQSSIEMALRNLNPMEEADTKEPWTSDVLLHDSIFVKIGDRLKRIKVEDILWIETAGNRYCKIITSKREAHVRSSLLKLSQQIPHLPLVRIHKSFLINMNHVEGIHETNQTIEIGGQDLPLGDSYKADFLKRINRF